MSEIINDRYPHIELNPDDLLPPTEAEISQVIDAMDTQLMNEENVEESVDLSSVVIEDGLSIEVTSSLSRFPEEGKDERQLQYYLGITLEDLEDTTPRIFVGFNRFGDRDSASRWTLEEVEIDDESLEAGSEDIEEEIARKALFKLGEILSYEIDGIKRFRDDLPSLLTKNGLPYNLSTTKSSLADSTDGLNNEGISLNSRSSLQFNKTGERENRTTQRDIEIATEHETSDGDHDVIVTVRKKLVLETGESPRLITITSPSLATGEYPPVGGTPEYYAEVDYMLNKARDTDLHTTTEKIATAGDIKVFLEKLETARRFRSEDPGMTQESHPI